MKKVCAGLLFCLVAYLTAGGFTSLVSAAEKAVKIPPPAVDNPKAAGAPQIAVLAGGCFWGVEGVYEHLHGVQRVVSGYAGGDKATAKYDIVSSGRTKHAESVEITFDPAEISYGEILQVYFSVVHDPTQLNRQGPDFGTQYRSSVFFVDARQKEIAERYIEQLDKAGIFPKPIVTRIDSFSGFYPAEDYHQEFLFKNPRHPYIVVNDLPKVENLKQLFADRYEERPAFSRKATAGSRLE